VRLFAFLLCFVVNPALTQAQSSVVLPFFNLTNNPENNWIGESFSESLAASLAEQDLLVVERADREQIYQRLAIKRYALLTRASVLKIAMSLDAFSAVYGQIEPAGQAGNDLKITAFVVNSRKLASLGEFTVTGPISNLSSMQSQLSWQVLRTLKQPLSLPESEYTASHPAIHVDALKNQVAGLLAKDDPQKLRFFVQATRIDPRYSAPAFELGKLYFRKKQWQESALWMSCLDGSSNHFREATFYLGIARYNLNDFDAAERAFAQVAETVPLNEVLNNLAAAQSRLKQEAALENFKKALNGAEADPAYQFNVGYALLKSGDPSAAAERFRAVLDRNPNDAQATEFLGMSLKGLPTEQIPEGAERLKTTYPENIFLQIKAILQPRKSN